MSDRTLKIEKKFGVTIKNIGGYNYQIEFGNKTYPDYQLTFKPMRLNECKNFLEKWVKSYKERIVK